MAAPSEIEIQAPGPQGPLKGAVVKPEHPGAPVVLIVPGSGPTDRDGNSPLGIKAATYRLLAQGLAAKGVTSVRIDKRGMFSSAQAVADPNDVTIDAYADDVHAWADAIRKTTGARCIWVLGHSEGALVALAAARQPEGLCGLILVAGTGRPLGAVLREQLKANPANAPLLAQAETALSTLEAGKRVDVTGLNPALLPLFAPQVQGYLINLLAFDPAKLISTYGGPVLIVQGDKDIQVSLADAERLQAADPRAHLSVLPGVNHVLKSVASDDRAANIATYVNPDLPLGPGVVDAIADFVRASPAG
jgi:uncharacterized protein